MRRGDAADEQPLTRRVTRRSARLGAFAGIRHWPSRVTIESLPAPVIVLIDAGRHRLGTSHVAPAHDASDHLTDYALRHGMLAWSPAPLRDGILRQHMMRALEGVRLLQVLTAALADARIQRRHAQGSGLLAVALWRRLRPAFLRSRSAGCRSTMRGRTRRAGGTRFLPPPAARCR